MYELSIVMPVYNAAKYLKNAIESIINQKNFNRIQLILVNDGSVDDSDAICKNYLSKYKNIIYLKQSNKGVSAARNYGINNAIGKFITFIDSDDFYVGDLYSVFIKNAQSSLVAFDMCKNSISNRFLNLENQVLTVDTDFILNYINNNSGFNIAYSVVNKIYDLSIIKKNNILFNEQTNYAEDMLFNLEYMKYITKLHVYNNIIYCYVDISTSAMNNLNSRTYDKYCICYLEIKKLCEYFSIDNKIAKVWLFDKMVLVLYSLLKSKKINQINKLFMNDILLNEKWLLKSDNITFRRKIIYFIYRMYNRGMRLLK